MPTQSRMMLVANDPIVGYFRRCLQTTRFGGKGNVPKIAMSDCVIMLRLLRMKLDDFMSPIHAKNPGRCRGWPALKKDMERVLGLGGQFYMSKWMATHMPRAFRNDSERGNKRHVIQFVELLNAYPGSKGKLQAVFDHCIEQHHRFWEAFSLKVIVQEDDPFQKRLLSLLSLQSLGRVQQGLVFSALRRRYCAGETITTKRTFAGDEQSSQSGTLQRGDVQVAEFRGHHT